MQDVIELRRGLHQIPELEFDLPLTRAFVLERLKGLPCTVQEAAGGILAFFDAGTPCSVALRADMDALPLTEATGLPYCSRHPGKMHACGHDGHTAMLLALAERLEPARLPHSVLLVFQPAEESSGGAQGIVQTGLMQRHGVKRVFGLHIWPGLEKHRLFSRPGPMMVGTCEVKVGITGKSAHVASAGKGKDAMLAGAEFLLQSYAVERELPEGAARLLKFGKFSAGSALNAVAATAQLHGSLRGETPELMGRLKAGVNGVAERLGRATGCEFSVEYSAGYPPVINDPGLFGLASRLLGVGEVPSIQLTAEDFSFYSECAPACFLMLGAGDAPPLHTVEFNFDEQILHTGVAALEKLALHPLE